MHHWGEKDLAQEHTGALLANQEPGYFSRYWRMSHVFSNLVASHPAPSAISLREENSGSFFHKPDAGQAVHPSSQPSIV